MKRLPRHAVDEALPAAETPAAPAHQCPLCGFRFSEGREVCGQCGLGGGCEAVGCPHCGYQFPVESTLLAWVSRRLRHLFGHRRRSA